MSRSNPSEHLSNPATRWFEWDGAKGGVRYYDKEAKTRVSVGSDFTFLFLDKLATIKGWHDPSQSGIYSNEVKDTTRDPMVVKAFKAPGSLAEGLYRDIKDRVVAAGGRFHTSLYIAYKNGASGLSTANLMLKGGALGAWMEFERAHRADILKQAVRINGMTSGKKGSVTFHVPKFEVHPVSPETDKQAAGLDVELQTYLRAYLKKNVKDQAAEHGRDEPEPDEYFEPPHPVMDEDIPF